MSLKMVEKNAERPQLIHSPMKSNRSRLPSWKLNVPIIAADARMYVEILLWRPALNMRSMYVIRVVVMI